MMKDEKKTKAQLIEELQDLRRQLSRLSRLQKKQRNVLKPFSESEAMYRNLLDVTPDLIFAVDRKGFYTYVNPRFEQALGYSLPELKGHPFTRVVDPKALASTLDRFRRGMRQEFLPPYEADLIAKDGRKIPVEFNVITLRDTQGKSTGRFGIGRDITERKLVEEALRESEKKYRGVIENIQDVFYRSDLNGRLLMGSPSGAKMFGYDKIDDMIGLPLDSFWQDVKDRERLLAQIKTTGSMKDYEAVLKRKDGTTFNASFTTHFYYDEEGHELGTEGIIRDITERKEAETLYRTLVNSSQTSTYILQDGRFQIVNPQSAKYSGFEENELIGQKALDFVHPEDRDRVRGCAVDMLKGKRSAPYEYRMVGRSGRVVSLVETVAPIHYQGRRAVLGNTMDITLMKEMKQSLRDSEMRYKAIFENIGAATLIVEKDATISLVNAEFENLTGYRRAEIEGKGKWTEFVAKEDMERMIADRRLRRTDKDRDLKNYEFDLVGKAGQVKKVLAIIDQLPETGKSIISLLNITERKRMEEALRESEEKYRLTVENSSEAICIVQDGVIKFSNDTARRRSGYSAEELAAITFLDFVHPDDREMVAERYRRRLEGEQEPAYYEVRCITKSGDMIYVRSSVVLITWEGRPAQLLFASDITEKKQLESLLQRAQRMEAIGTLAGGIAHDFNNILSAIMGYTELVLDDISKDGRDYEYLTRVFRASERARDLVKQILDFSRQSKQELRPLMITPLMKEALRLLRASIPTTIKIVQRIQADRDLILADPTQIHQVIMNLCTNAAHAMRDRGGTLTVSLSDKTVRHDDPAPLPDMRPGPYAVLEVRDTGHGIDPAIMDRIFDPFFTTKTRGEGTGMGLSVVHGIIRSHDGYIMVENDAGKGTAFYVYLPILAEKETAPIFEEETPHRGGGKHVLVVDDEAEIAELIKEMLTDLDYRVMSRTSSSEALDLFKTDSLRYDLVITDQTMPNMTGMELAHALLQIRPEIPIILCTGFSEKLTPDMVKSAGIREYVMKPIIQRQMAETIRRALGSTTIEGQERWDKS